MNPEPVAPARGRPWLLRAVLVALGIGLWFLTQSLIGARTPPAGGIDDGMHRLLAPLHDYFLGAPLAANVLMIISSAFIDGLAIFVLARAIFGESLRPFLGLLLLFALRQLMEALCSLPTPPEMIWHYPGFQAILVTYGVATDLFFSGHTSVAVYGALELGRLGRKWLLCGIAIIVFEALTVLTLRAHYTMDVFAAIMAALVAAGVAERVAPAADRALERLRGG
jgi:hypothetical protein